MNIHNVIEFVLHTRNIECIAKRIDQYTYSIFNDDYDNAYLFDVVIDTNTMHIVNDKTTFVYIKQNRKRFYKRDDDESTLRPKRRVIAQFHWCIACCVFHTYNVLFINVINTQIEMMW